MSKSLEKETKKAKTLFDHLKMITEKQEKDYWTNLSEADKRTWSNYMVLRFLSMKPEWTETIAELQPIVQTLDPPLLYEVLIGVLPKGKYFLKYTKGKSEDKFEPWLVNLVATFFESSSTTAIDYLTILYGTEDGHRAIARICEIYGTEPKKIKKLGLKYEKQ